MKTDMKRFTEIADRLVFLTTRDEYGTSRSRDIETISDLAEELNSEGICAPRGEWTGNSLKLYINRLKGRYGRDVLIDNCNLDFIGANAWEYASHTHHSQVVQKGKSGGVWNTGNMTKSYPLQTYEPMEGEAWKEHELDDVVFEDKKIFRKSKIITKR